MDDFSPGPTDTARASGRVALVTGAAGFIGSHLAERLVSSGDIVRAVDCFTPYYDVRQKSEALRPLESLPGCSVITADLRTCDMNELLDGVDVIFHQAGQPGVRASWDRFVPYVEHNVLATKRILDAAVRTPIRRFVYASSSSVYGNAPRYPAAEDDPTRPVSPYGVTKLAAESLCGAFAVGWGVPTVALRYFTVYGPGQRPDMAIHRMIEAAISGDSFPIYGNGRQVRDFTFVDDVIEANLLAASRDVPEGSVLNIAGGTATELLGVTGIVEELVGRPLQLCHRAAERGDVERIGGSNERAQRLLGWAPMVSLTDGLSRQVEWHVSRRAVRRSA
jgi:UDP-glucuronate 4-epimerase